MTRFATLFMLVLISLFTLEMQSSVQQALIEPFTAILAKTSAALILPVLVWGWQSRHTPLLQTLLYAGGNVYDKQSDLAQ